MAMGLYGSTDNPKIQVFKGSGASAQAVYDRALAAFTYGVQEALEAVEILARNPKFTDDDWDNTVQKLYDALDNGEELIEVTQEKKLQEREIRSQHRKPESNL